MLAQAWNNGGGSSAVFSAARKILKFIILILNTNTQLKLLCFHLAREQRSSDFQFSSACTHKSSSFNMYVVRHLPTAAAQPFSLHMSTKSIYLFSNSLSLACCQVAGVVGRAEILCSVFFLAAFIFYTRAARRKKSTGK